MVEYIEREAACTKMPDDYYGWRDKQILNFIPAADVVPVVRCIDCKHWHRSLSDDGKIEFFNFSYCEKGRHGFPNFFCADGERKDGDGE